MFEREYRLYLLFPGLLLVPLVPRQFGMTTRLLLLPGFMRPWGAGLSGHRLRGPEIFPGLCAVPDCPRQFCVTTLLFLHVAFVRPHGTRHCEMLKSGSTERLA
jgi:hypothetical protein